MGISEHARLWLLDVGKGGPVGKSIVHRLHFEQGRSDIAPGGGALLYAAARNARPRFTRALATGFVISRWNIRQRFARAARHFDIVASLGHPFSVGPREQVELLQIPEVAEGYRLTLDQPSWLSRDGLLTLSLWVGSDRYFSLSFVLGSERGRLVAHVGGLQGRAEEGALEVYRALTKAAHGMRPRDLLIELFRIVCEEAGVQTIFAASSTTHYHRSLYYRLIKRCETPTMNYDTAWSDRGGVLRPDGLFELKPGFHLRNLDEVPAKKRSMYRNRQGMLCDLRSNLALALAIPERLVVSKHGDPPRSYSAGNYIF